MMLSLFCLSLPGNVASSRYLDEFFTVIYPAIESCYNSLGSILGVLKHALYSQFTIPSLVL